MEREDLREGDYVYFSPGKPAGVKAYIREVYRKNVRIEIREEQGKYAIGQCARVPPAMLHEERPDAFDYKAAAQDATDYLKKRGTRVPDWLEDPMDYLTGRPCTRHCRERDFQRKAVYSAEPDDIIHNFSSLGHLRAYLDGLRQHEWFVAHFGTVPNLDVVASQRGARRSVYLNGRAQIRMTRFDLDAFLHELAHHLTPRPHADHGPLFARTLLELNRHLIDRCFVDQYHIQGVLYGISH